MTKHYRQPLHRGGAAQGDNVVHVSAEKLAAYKTLFGHATPAGVATIINRWLPKGYCFQVVKMNTYGKVNHDTT